jgi:hypothetical protein
MVASTLYESLGTRTHDAEGDRGRTRKTANPETIDDDRMVPDLYLSLGDPVVSDGSDVGRTEITRESRETVDKDRAVYTLSSSLFAPPRDLYGALATRARQPRVDRGETAITASTETIDWDQPSDIRYT